MKREELRIGNYFQWSPCATMWRGVDRITHGQQIEDYLILKDGIPITDEWLIKFGFTKPNDWHCYMLGLGNSDTESSIQIPFLGADTAQICRAGINAYSMPCQYVHQLQNIYYAITGKELEFNESAGNITNRKRSNR